MRLTIATIIVIAGTYTASCSEADPLSTYLAMKNVSVYTGPSAPVGAVSIAKDWNHWILIATKSVEPVSVDGHVRDSASDLDLVRLSYQNGAQYEVRQTLYCWLLVIPDAAVSVTANPIENQGILAGIASQYINQFSGSFSYSRSMDDVQIFVQSIPVTNDFRTTVFAMIGEKAVYFGGLKTAEDRTSLPTASFDRNSEWFSLIGGQKSRQPLPSR